jgi:hypothetical protein
VEHRHRCVYCRSEWFCYEDCPLAGLSACEGCREKLRESPDMPRRVIALNDTRVLDRLAQREADRIRRNLWKDPEP